MAKSGDQVPTKQALLKKKLRARSSFSRAEYSGLLRSVRTPRAESFVSGIL
jgi:hypothetical protein